MVAGIIMASGFSRRMGRDKLMIEIDGKRLCEYAIDACLSSSLCDIVVVARKAELIDIAKSKGARTCMNEKAIEGQSSSIRLGIRSCRGADGYMFLTCDQPFMDSKLIDSLICEFEKNSNFIIIPSFNQKSGSPCIFPSSLADELMSLSGDQKGRQVIKKHKDMIRFVEIEDANQLFDIDTRKDLLNALKIKKGD